ncbi:hypothetical protein [Streptomyces sp. NPDC090025]|uniref:hypothetical protein n=1 Tax=Streptomyces sp. NPDC090025 TaxID=3365922 RepID=UPI0038366B3F
MTDTQPDVLSPRDEARLELSFQARKLAGEAAALVPVETDPKPGSLITQAKELVRLAEELLNAAVVAERERGLSPNKIHEVTGRPHWNMVVLDWAQDGRRNRSGVPGPALARSLDEWASRETPGTENPVTDGLDASRFPGSAQYEAYQRGRVADLYAALTDAQEERGRAWDALNELTEEDLDGDHGVNGVEHPVNVRVVTTCRNLAAVYQELFHADPALAHEYQQQATTFEEVADRFATDGPLG